MVGETGTAAQKVLRGLEMMLSYAFQRAFCGLQRMGLMRPD